MCVLNREKEDDLERRFVLLDQELRDILAIDGECQLAYFRSHAVRK